MAQNANKTEHSGAKKGRGAYWGRKKDAKEESSKRRRTNEREQLSRESENDESKAGE